MTYILYAHRTGCWPQPQSGPCTWTSRPLRPSSGRSPQQMRLQSEVITSLSVVRNLNDISVCQYLYLSVGASQCLAVSVSICSTLMLISFRLPPYHRVLQPGPVRRGQVRPPAGGGPAQEGHHRLLQEWPCQMLKNYCKLSRKYRVHSASDTVIMIIFHSIHLLSENKYFGRNIDEPPNTSLIRCKNCQNFEKVASC